MRRGNTRPYVRRFGNGFKAAVLACGLTPVAVGACSSADSGVRGNGELQQGLLGVDCDFTVSTSVATINTNGFTALVSVTNGSSLTSTGFKVLVRAGDAVLQDMADGTFEAVEGGYMLTPGTSQLKPGKTYVFELTYKGAYASPVASIISNNGANCDQKAPSVSLSLSSDFVRDGTLTLTADASDNRGVDKVVFAQDGVNIGTAVSAPFTFDIAVTSELDGPHRYTATAYDITGNQATSERERALVAVDTFFGSAVDPQADMNQWPSFFNQVTPGNAGKWGSVETTRDVMNWTALDTAHDFAEQKGIPFKLHTLIWGQQQPSWMSGTALTDAEKLAEIDEWMAAVAERYPDLELIDVVNEPMHAVPSYASALGGAGATGYDWVIKAFEMARRHFPNADLILNEYNVVVLSDYTTSFLNLVNLLETRGLIDGIGEQGHFLERADPATVAANLQRLAGTGLPIYISELELAFANDAQQANVMSKLFPVLWENPNVVGVTHWGYRQGAMWRADGYLVRSDGSYRPALDWLLCYMGGAPSCSVPEYVPPPRAGDQTVLMLQAEDYDAAQGCIALGGTVAYTDNGDWERFDRVVFDANYNQLSVTYAKGNTDTTSSISLYLDSLESEPVATIAMPPTGGWGTNRTVSANWTALSGEHTLFVRFNGGYGVVNLDSLTFSAPSSNLIKNGSFEVLGTQGWSVYQGTLAATTDRAHSGSYSLRHSGRTASYAGPQALLTAFVTRGASYPISFWVSVGNAATAQPVKLTQTWNCGGGAEYAQVTSSVNVAEGQWVQLKGIANVPDCALTDYRIYVEGPAGGVDIYVDDAKLLVPEANIVAPGTFESGSTENWGSWIGSSVPTQDRAHGGLWSLSSFGTATARPQLVRNLSGLIPGNTYVASMWISTNSASSQYVHLQGQYKCSNGTTQYPWLANPNVPAGTGWVKLAALIDVPACSGGTLEWFNLYAEAGNPGAFVLYLDDASVNHFSFDQP